MSDLNDLLGIPEEESGEFETPKSGNGLPPVVRGDRFDLGQWSEPQKLITWMNNMRRVPLDGIDDAIVDRSYAAAVWLFRKAAVEGDLKAATAMEKWLAWAKPIINRPKPASEAAPSKGSVAFLPRDPGLE